MILNSPYISGSLTVTGNIITSGSITISGSIASASYASNADLLDGLDATVFTLTSSFNAQTASFTAFTASLNAFSASQNSFTASILAQTASLNSFSASILSYTASQNILNGTYTLTSSFNAQTASFTAFTSSINAFSASVLTFTGSATTRLGALESYTSSLNAKTASFATTGSNNFIGTQTITGSVLQSGSFTSTGTLTAQTLVVQTITSSVVYSSGSNIFGNALNNTQTFTGSVLITGSLTIAGGSSATSYSGTTIYGSTAVCSPVGKFTSCIDACVGYFSGCVGIGTTTIPNKLTLGGGSDGLTNMLGIYNTGINNLTAIGKGTAIILGGNTDGNYSAKIAMVYEGQNPSYLQPALAFYTMNNTSDYGSEVERMRITSTGNVGIGTCTPTGTYGKLSVAGGISILNDNCAKLQIGRYSNVSTDSYIVMANGSTGLTFTNANDVADVMRITTGGNVGIGTNSPSGTGILLNVKGITGNTIGMVIAESADGCAMVSLYSGSGIGDDPSLIYLKDLRFGSGNKSTAGYVERMRIASCGNVGIGVTCPVEKLDIMGALRVRCNTPGFTIACNSLVIDYANTCVFGSAPMTRYYSIGCTGVSAGHTFLVGEPSVGYNAFIIGGSGHVTKPCSAAFHAAINSSTCIGSGGTVIKFNCVIYNAGGGYNGTTSTFTAPVSGMYQFNFTFLNQNVQNVDGGHAYLLTSSGVGTYYMTRYGCFSGTDRTGYGNYVPMHGAIAVYLPGGATACVGAFWDGPGAFTHNSTAWSNFTGYLVG